MGGGGVIIARLKQTVHRRTAESGAHFHGEGVESRLIAHPSPASLAVDM